MDIKIYAEGLCHMSVCAAAELKRKQVERAVNAESPTGISHPWRITEKFFIDGKSNPCPCNVDSKTRRHWLLTC